LGRRIGNDSTLTLQLAESGNRITGSYCYISQRGNRIDCPEDDERNLSGTIAGNRAVSSTHRLAAQADGLFWK
jgi:hypothetical protein